MRITKVTTKIGDKGTTRLGTNEVVSKSSLEIHVLGDLDELSSVLGMVKVAGQTEELKSNIENIQNNLFNIGGEVALGNSGDELLKACANYLNNNQIEEAWQLLHLGKII